MVPNQVDFSLGKETNPGSRPIKRYDGTETGPARDHVYGHEALLGAALLPQAIGQGIRPAAAA